MHLAVKFMHLAVKFMHLAVKFFSSDTRIHDNVRGWKRRRREKAVWCKEGVMRKRGVNILEFHMFFI